MFHNTLKKVGAICCAVIALSCEVVALSYKLGMDYGDLGGECLQNHPIYREYADYGHEIWTADGKRFIDVNFMDTYARTGGFIILNDGRPEFYIWFNMTCSGLISDWSLGNIFRDALPFLRHMHCLYEARTKPYDRVVMELIGVIRGLESGDFD
ncbi:MAG: hypothetical protein LBJ89_01710 [Holosporales bacterium]|jgi:hypothetical protein|nr:hypothetical protein [Holosporales bacterium]